MGEAEIQREENPKDDEKPKSEMGGELMLFDDGSMTADKAQSSAMSLIINYADPALAAGTAVLGLGLVVLPFLSKLNKLASDDTFRYQAHGETNAKQPMRLFTEAELRQRLGSLDVDAVAMEITMSTNELDEHMEASSMEETDDEVSRIQKWRDSVNANLKSLQKRSALAFLGLPPDSNMNDINAMYKKMALELHPDKGGDPEKFQELQEMKERLTDLEKDEEDGKDGKKDTEEDPEEEEARKLKEKEEEEEKNRLPPNERIKKLRMDVHDNTVRLWERAKKSRDEIVGDKALKSNSQPALNILRLFVERFVANEIKTLRHDDTRGAEAKLRKFLKQGAEILSVAALADVQATLSTLAMHFNYRLVARSGSPDIKNKCAALLEAVGEVPQLAEQFLQQMEADLADQRDRDKRRKERMAAEQREREARGDFSGEAGKKSDEAQAKAKSEAKPAQKEPHANGGYPDAKSQATQPKPSEAKPDPFADFDFGEPKKAAAPKAAPKSEAVAVKTEDDRSAIQAAVKQKRTSWDAAFDHPYAGALKSNGTGIYCRPCQRWIVTYEYNTEVFLTHVERVHPKPPPGWSV
ncbi:DJA6 [Symbiodinium pilosum]|uniref:DJA6 protein n=1 Tax=Symbiodinium pilosum TaxID=2952 RepID=A0A812S083_SYMPI|nr:DJA6 [Symbiodinium pilosum]